MSMINGSTFKRRTHRSVTTAFLWACVIGFAIVVVSIVFGLFIPLFFAPTEKVLVSKLVYASNGMLFGVFQILLGILLALIGITSDYDLDASVGPAKVKLVSASPGLLLILCGNLLIGFALSRQFEVAEYRQEPPAKSSTTNSKPFDVPPLPNGGP